MVFVPPFFGLDVFPVFRLWGRFFRRFSVFFRMLLWSVSGVHFFAMLGDA